MKRMTFIFFVLALITGCEKTINVAGVSLDKPKTTISVGSTETLIATVSPNDADNKNVTWASSAETVATVDASGVVTAVATGMATITVTTEEGGKTATCEVTVTPVIVVGVMLSKSETTLIAGSTETLAAVVSPDGSGNKNVTWTSSAEAVATVSPNGLVTAIAAGTAIITVTTEDGGKTASCIVTVIEIVTVTGVTLNKSETTLIAGLTETLVATVSPDNADNKNVTWTSSAETVATVNTSGVVTAVAPGTAIITVTTEDGDKTATCTVTVKLPTPDGVSINGITWATRNVNSPGVFADNPGDVGMYYQWNRKLGLSATNPLVTSEGVTVGTGEPSEWFTSWRLWDGNLAETWEATNDPCPEGWRVPTKAEFESLYAAGSVWTTQDGVLGRVFGSGENIIFMPAAGYRNFRRGEITGVGTDGIYWSSMLGTITGGINFYYNLYFTNASVIGSDDRSGFGFCVRCVLKDE